MGIFAFNKWGSSSSGGTGEKRQKCCSDSSQHHHHLVHPCFTSPHLHPTTTFFPNVAAPSDDLSPPSAPSTALLRLGASYDLYLQHTATCAASSRNSHGHQSPQHLNLYYKPFLHQQQHQTTGSSSISTAWNTMQGSAATAASGSSSSRSGVTRTSELSSASCNSSYEHLFYKVVTPSDVGKLNRLVIPKQHAERWFPLDPCLRKKGRLLSFQDVVSRELWWFRYSYWSSSQSYVLTKGWIRFVKEKDLQAGDIISFERGDRHQLYINCRKRPTSNRTLAQLTTSAASPTHRDSLAATQQHKPSSSSKQLFPSSGSSDEEEEEEEVPAAGTRLFGVDLRAKPMLQQLQAK